MNVSHAHLEAAPILRTARDGRDVPAESANGAAVRSADARQVRGAAPSISSPARPGRRPVVISERQGGESQLRIEGTFDALTVGDISPAMDAVVAECPRRVTVDLDKVPLMDSSGARAIMSLWKRVTAQGGAVAVVHAHDQPLMVLKLLKLDVVLGA